MRAPCIPLLLTLACTPRVHPPSSPGTTPITVSDEQADPTSSLTADLPWPSEVDCDALAQRPVDPTVHERLRTIVGGHYAVDHLGPEAFSTIEDHVAAEPDAYLDAWVHALLEPSVSLGLRWANLLGRTSAPRPDQTRLVAGCVLPRFDQALAAKMDPDEATRVGQQQRQIYRVWRGQPDTQDRRLAEPTSACIEGTTLRVEVACTCGEVVGCHVAVGPDRTDALVSLDLRTTQLCRDCYPSTGTCSLPPSSPAALTINGRTMALGPCPPG